MPYLKAGDWINKHRLALKQQNKTLLSIKRGKTDALGSSNISLERPIRTVSPFMLHALVGGAAYMNDLGPARKPPSFMNRLRFLRTYSVE